MLHVVLLVPILAGTAAFSLERRFDTQTLTLRVH